MRLLLIITGGIAAYKIPELVRSLKKDGHEVRCVLTKSAEQFVTPLTLSTLSGERAMTDLWSLTDESEIGHIKLARDCDQVLVAPCTADMMAKMAHGQADDLATTLLLATDKPVTIAPAMNPYMWEHAATQSNLETLKARGIDVIAPVEGDMACGETGIGRMPEPADIYAALLKKNSKPLAGLKAIVTSGPTHEAIDPVRFIGNHSSGKQGHAIAASLRDAGAEVILVSGPTAASPPHGVKTLSIKSAAEMKNAVSKNLPADITICAAAVADWKAIPSPAKIKKAQDVSELNLTLTKTDDILKWLGHLPQKDRPKLVIGFAAETENLSENMMKKLNSKQADVIIGNCISSDNPAFGEDKNSVSWLDKNQGTEEWNALSKLEIASRITDKIIDLLEIPK